MTEARFDGTRNVDVEMLQLEQHLATLKTFETDRQDPQVEHARKVLRDFLTPYRTRLAENGLIPTIHGSMQYHDPRNLDSDLTFLGENTLPHDTYMELIFETITKQLEDIWPTGDLNVEVGTITFEEIQADIDSNRDPFDADIFLGSNASIILSSMPLYPEDTDALDALRDKTKSLLRAHPNFLQKTIQVLQQTIDIRRERRVSNTYLDKH
jgi:hypothetical protein